MTIPPSRISMIVIVVAAGIHSGTARAGEGMCLHFAMMAEVADVCKIGTDDGKIVVMVRLLPSW